MSTSPNAEQRSEKHRRTDARDAMRKQPRSRLGAVQAALRTVTRILDAFFEHTPTPLAILDRNLDYIEVNAAYAQAFGRTVADFPSRNHFTIFPPDARDIFEEVVRTKQPYHALARPLAPADSPGTSTMYWNWTLTPILDDAGDVQFLVFSLEDVTERQRGVEALRRSQQSLEEAQRIARLGNWDWDIEHNTLTWSKEIYRIFGLAPEEFRATYEAFMERVHPEDRVRVTEAVERAIHGGEPYEIEHRIVRPDGSERIVHERGDGFRDEHGRSVRMLGTVQDVTERRRAERRTEAVNALLRLFADQTSRKAYLDAVVALLRDLSGCRCVGIRVLNDRGEVPYEAHTGFDRAFIDSECWLAIRRDVCACTRVIAGTVEPQDVPLMTPRGAFRCNDIVAFVQSLDEKARTRFRGACMRKGYRSVAVVPVRYRERILGAMHLADERCGRVEPDTVEFMESVAPLIGEALYRFGVEDALRESERRFRGIFDSTATFIGLLRPDGTLIEANRRALDFAGVRREDVVGHPFWETPWWGGSAERQKRIRLAVAEAAAGRSVRFHIEATGARNRVIVVDFSLTPVRDDDGKVVLLIPEGRDVTEERRLHEALAGASKLERQKIGQDLHDVIGQNLAGLAFMSQLLHRNLAAAGRPEAADAGKIEAIANRAVSLARSLARGVAPVAVGPDGLRNALEALAADVENMYGVACSLRCDGSGEVHNDHAADHLYYIAQEAVRNAITHGRARRIVIRLRTSDGRVTLSVRDDGTGIPERHQRKPGMGMRFMRHRAAAIGGFLSVRRLPGSGTLVTCWAPDRQPTEVRDYGEDQAADQP